MYSQHIKKEPSEPEPQPQPEGTKNEVQKDQKVTSSKARSKSRRASVLMKEKTMMKAQIAGGAQQTEKLVSK